MKGRYRESFGMGLNDSIEAYGHLDAMDARARNEAKRRGHTHGRDWSIREFEPVVLAGPGAKRVRASTVRDGVAFRKPI